MRDYAILGAKYHGKTWTAKELVRDILKEIPTLKLYVFDKNREWGAPDLPKMDVFLERIQAARDAIAVFEDAGVFFSNRGRSEKLLDILTAARHNRVVCILIFHAMFQVPEYVWIHLDAVIIHKTKDDPQDVHLDFRKRRDILEAWDRVQAHPWKHHKETVYL